MGKILYRYMPWDAFEKSIMNWSLKATHPCHTNDLFEFMPVWASEKAEFHSIMKILREEFVFFSFSEKMSNCAMWGHYADQFRGVCMVFYFPFTVPIRQVEYDINRVRLEDYKNEKEAIKLYDRILATKDESWRYESEWRLVKAAHEADDAYDDMLLYKYPMKYFIGVILGVNCSHSTGYTKKLIHKNSNTLLSTNSPYFVTRSFPDNEKYIIHNEFWKDNMNVDKVKEAGFILNESA